MVFMFGPFKRVRYQGGSNPAARCKVTNVASRQTLQRAGFVPCWHLLHETVARRA